MHLKRYLLPFLSWLLFCRVKMGWYKGSSGQCFSMMLCVLGVLLGFCVAGQGSHGIIDYRIYMRHSCDIYSSNLFYAYYIQPDVMALGVISMAGAGLMGLVRGQSRSALLLRFWLGLAFLHASMAWSSLFGFVAALVVLAISKDADCFARNPVWRRFGSRCSTSAFFPTTWWAKWKPNKSTSGTDGYACPENRKQCDRPNTV